MTQWRSQRDSRNRTALFPHTALTSQHTPGSPLCVEGIWRNPDSAHFRGYSYLLALPVYCVPVMQPVTQSSFKLYHKSIKSLQITINLTRNRSLSLSVSFTHNLFSATISPFFFNSNWLLLANGLRDFWVIRNTHLHKAKFRLK